MREQLDERIHLGHFVLLQKFLQWFAPVCCLEPKAQQRGVKCTAEMIKGILEGVTDLQPDGKVYVVDLTANRRLIHLYCLNRKMWGVRDFNWLRKYRFMVLGFRVSGV